MTQDVFCIVEHSSGRIAEVTFELLGKGRELASARGGALVAVHLGKADDERRAALGAADRVIEVDHPRLSEFDPEAWVAALAHVVREKSPWVTLVPNTSMGMDLAAALAVINDLPLAAYAVSVAAEGERIVATSQLYGGKILTESVLEGACVVSVLAGSFSADEGRKEGAPDVESLAPPPELDQARVRLLGLVEPEAGDVDITQAEVLVCVGRGIQSEDNLPLAEQLADALGGVVCSSRPVVDNKWLPKTRQVGKSGLKVKPRVYVALGVSGAPEHIEGMKDAELIVAVNTDENAPIFEVAHYGTTEDLFDLVPALTEKLRS